MSHGLRERQVRGPATPSGEPKTQLVRARRYRCLHEAASGSVRDIDRAARNALRVSGRKKRKLVERDVVQSVLPLD